MLMAKAMLTSHSEQFAVNLLITIVFITLWVTICQWGVDILLCPDLSWGYLSMSLSESLHRLPSICQQTKFPLLLTPYQFWRLFCWWVLFYDADVPQWGSATQWGSAIEMIMMAAAVMFEVNIYVFAAVTNSVKLKLYDIYRSSPVIQYYDLT